MGYFGRPSKNCLGCRQRRIKCDLRLPACTQCKRAGMKCAGYRDQQALAFRDETARAQHRSVTAKDRSFHQQAALLLPNYYYPIGLPAAPSMTIDEYGLTFFLDRFSTAPERSLSINSSQPADPIGVAVHPFITSMIFREPSRDALVSVGLAALSNTTGDKAYLTAAIKRYIASINLVRRAIEEPSKANLEDAIKVALILMLYEFVNNTRGPQSWSIHADGALALFRQINNGRMPLKPEEMAGLQSYLFVIMKHFGSGKEIPKEILEWSSPQYASPVLNTTSNLITILIRFVHLTATLKAPNSTIKDADVVDLALAIDADLSDWEAGLVGDDWSFVTEMSNQPFSFYHGKYHVYKNVWTSRVRNHYRWSRILVNELLYLYTSKLATLTPSQTKERQQSALNTISRLAADICISVPSHSRLFGNGFGPLSGRVSGGCGPGGCERNDFPPLNGVFILVFALVIAGSAIGVPDELHNWVVKVLEMIDASMGMRYAAELIPVVKRMRRSRKTSFWGGINIW